MNRPKRFQRSSSRDKRRAEKKYYRAQMLLVTPENEWSRGEMTLAPEKR